MTVTKRTFTDLAYWQRYGRGRSLEFFSVDEEIAKWLTTSLPAKYAPYELVGEDRIKQGDEYIAYPFRCNPEKFIECVSDRSKERTRFWIWSQFLTPDLDFKMGASFTKHLSLSGLVHIQHGSRIRVRNPRDPAVPKERVATYIGIVDRIFNNQTESIYEHTEYLEIYKSLHRTIKKELVYSSWAKFMDGHEEETTRMFLMTEGAVQAYEAGIQFINRPGRRLK